MRSPMTQSSPCSPQLERAWVQHQSPTAANKLIKKNFNLKCIKLFFKKKKRWEMSRWWGWERRECRLFWKQNPRGADMQTKPGFPLLAKCKFLDVSPGLSQWLTQWPSFGFSSFSGSPIFLSWVLVGGSSWHHLRTMRRHVNQVNKLREMELRLKQYLDPWLRHQASELTSAFPVTWDTLLLLCAGLHIP